MAYIYEGDVGRLGGNLQKTVGYLLSLHKAEYEWNLLGIKVVGHVDALPIPDGTYEYGDAYTVGTAAPYDMWIYTRADEFHSEAYWFNIGKFPAPGPQGPKGDGLEQIYKWTNGTVSNVVYDTTDGAKTTQTTTIDYTDSTDGSTKQQQFNSTTTLPIVPGKYMSMDATSDNKKLEVKVDDTALALEFYKIDKTAQATISAPVYVPGSGTSVVYVTPDVLANSIAKRNSNGETKIRKLYVNRLATTAGEYDMPLQAAYYGGFSDGFTVDKTPTDKGTLTEVVMDAIKSYPNAGIKYNNQSYIRMDPMSAPDGTLNYIHLDSIQDGEGGYKATGKCFSITVSKRAWQVVDIDFGRSYTHNVIIENGSTGDFVHFTLINHHPDSYAENADGLLVSIGEAKINCTVTDGARYYAGIIYQDGYFHFEYGDSNHVQATTSQVTITDTVF